MGNARTMETNDGAVAVDVVASFLARLAWLLAQLRVMATQIESIGWRHKRRLSQCCLRSGKALNSARTERPIGASHKRWPSQWDEWGKLDRWALIVGWSIWRSVWWQIGRHALLYRRISSNRLRRPTMDAIKHYREPKVVHLAVRRSLLAALPGEWMQMLPKIRTSPKLLATARVRKVNCSLINCARSMQ